MRQLNVMRSVLVTTALALASVVTAGSLVTRPATGATRHVDFGIFRPLGRSATASLPTEAVDMQAVRNRQDALGHHIDIVHSYGLFAVPPSLADLEVVAANGSDPMLSELTFNPTPTYASIAAGALDGAVAGWAGVLSAFAAVHPDRKVHLRLDFEMNGPYNRWSPCHKNPGQPQLDSTPAQFVAAWRHLHDRFTALATPAAVQATRWVWSIVDVNPAKDSDPCRLDIASFYPGDAYVDELGMDVYDELATDGSFQATAQPSYDALASLAGSSGTLPITINEMATGHAYGATAPPEPYRANWIASIGPALVNTFPRISAIVWFDVVKERLYAIDGCNDPNLPTTDSVPPPGALTDPNTPKLPQNWRTWGGQPFGYVCPGPDQAAVAATQQLLAQPPFSP
ncbi:MAG TPA: glycosyl hydrolase [Acidimicrobiales bacterium]|nr:glycosyl hydrolase [Acidimicrobiales bacterium]